MTTQWFRDLPRSTQVFSGVLWCALLGTSAWAIHIARPEVVVGLTVIFAAANLVPPVPNPRGGVNVPNLSLIVVAVLLWPPSEVLLGVSLGHFVGQIMFRKLELWRAAWNAGLQGLPAAASSIAAHEILGAFSPGYGPLILAGLVTVATYRILNMGLFSAYRSTRFKYRFLEDWWGNVTANRVSQLLSAPLAIWLAAIAYRIPSPWPVLGLTGLSAMLTLPIARYELAYYQRSRKIFEQIVESVAGALERVAPGALAHSRRVSALAIAVARRLRLPERTVMVVGLAAQLHDIGLLGSSVTAAEALAEHAAVGARILARFPDPAIADMVRHHHDHWDGSPPIRSRRALAVGSRILAACEVYESARTGLAPFTDPHTHDEAAALLRARAGTALDPKLVPIVVETAAALADRHEGSAA